jgi:hypothetical protein
VFSPATTGMNFTVWDVDFTAELDGNHAEAL